MLIDRLERGVMDHSPVGKCKSPRVGDPFFRPLTLYDLGCEKERFDLIFGEGRLVGSSDEACTSQTQGNGENESPTLQGTYAHRNTSGATFVSYLA
jgi:hypothetical protein